MSKQCKYAIKALVRLAAHYQKGNILTSEISKKEGIPRKFLEQILIKLKHKGYVGSKAGYNGGFYLKQHPTKITVADIYRLFDGAIALVPCVAYQYYEKCDDCKNEKTCTLRREFKKIREQTRNVMTETTIQSFL